MIYLFIFSMWFTRRLDRWAMSTEINQAVPLEGASHLRHTSCLTPIASMRIEPMTSIPRGLATGAQPIELNLGAASLFTKMVLVD